MHYLQIPLVSSKHLLRVRIPLLESKEKGKNGKSRNDTKSKNDLERLGTKRIGKQPFEYFKCLV